MRSPRFGHPGEQVLGVEDPHDVVATFLKDRDRESPVRRKVAAASAAETVDANETIDDRGVINSPTSVRVKTIGLLQEHAGRLGQLGLGVLIGRIVLDGDLHLQVSRPVQCLRTPGQRFHQPLDLSQPKRQGAATARSTLEAGQSTSTMTSANTLPITPATTYPRVRSRAPAR